MTRSLISYFQNHFRSRQNISSYANSSPHIEERIVEKSVKAVDGGRFAGGRGGGGRGGRGGGRERGGVERGGGGENMEGTEAAAGALPRVAFGRKGRSNDRRNSMISLYSAQRRRPTNGLPALLASIPAAVPSPPPAPLWPPSATNPCFPTRVRLRRRRRQRR